MAQDRNVVQSIKNQIRNKQRRLQKLKEKEALKGVDAEAVLLLEIEDLEAEINQLRSGLQAVTSGAGVHAPSDEIGETLPAAPGSENNQDRSKWLVPLLVALIGLVGTIFIPLWDRVFGSTPTPAPTRLASVQFNSFNYLLQLRANNNDTPISGAKIVIDEIPDKVPLRSMTDVNGLARLFIPESYKNLSGRLVIDIDGYEKHWEFVDLTRGALPETIHLRRSTPATPRPEPTSPPTSTSSIMPAASTTRPVTTKTPLATGPPTSEPEVVASATPPLPAPETPSPTISPTPTSMVRQPTPSPTIISARSPTVTPTPSPILPTPTVFNTPPSPTPTPVDNASHRDLLAIPTNKVDPNNVASFTVYVTNFQGRGMIDGTTPVILSNARQPMFRADARAIVIKSPAEGVFVTNQRGEEACSINNQPDVKWPVWSPSGDEVIFTDDKGDYKTLFRQNSQCHASFSALRVVSFNGEPVNGENALWVRDGQNQWIIFKGCASWLPDGSGTCGIWITDHNFIAPPQRIVVGLNGSPTDAKQGLLTYVSNEDGDWDVYVVPLDARDVEQGRNITNNNGIQDGLAAISPDGTQVAYISNELVGRDRWALWTVNLHNGRKQLWFEIDPRRGTFDETTWAGERMSWGR